MQTGNRRDDRPEPTEVIINWRRAGSFFKISEHLSQDDLEASRTCKITGTTRIDILPGLHFLTRSLVQAPKSLSPSAFPNVGGGAHLKPAQTACSRDLTVPETDEGFSAVSAEPPPDFALASFGSDRTNRQFLQLLAEFRKSAVYADHKILSVCRMT